MEQLCKENPDLRFETDANGKLIIISPRTYVQIVEDDWQSSALRDPDFVIELLSPTDNLATTQQKMLEYMDCGIKLGWLINPDEKQVTLKD